MTKSASKSRVLLILGSTILFLSLIILDQVTKTVAVDALADGSIPLIEGVLEFLYIQNTGMAFSFLTGKTFVFFITTPVIIFIILFFYIKIPHQKKYMPVRFLIVFILSGAIGNLIDRIKLGYVRDFIYFKLIDFPVFNLADIYVTCSVILLMILYIFYYKESDFDFIFPKKKDA